MAIATTLCAPVLEIILFSRLYLGMSKPYLWPSPRCGIWYYLKAVEICGVIYCTFWVQLLDIVYGWYSGVSASFNLCVYIFQTKVPACLSYLLFNYLLRFFWFSPIYFSLLSVDISILLSVSLYILNSNYQFIVLTLL